MVDRMATRVDDMQGRLEGGERTDERGRRGRHVVEQCTHGDARHEAGSTSISSTLVVLVSEAAACAILTLPLYPWLRHDDLTRLRNAQYQFSLLCILTMNSSFEPDKLIKDFFGIMAC